MREKIAEIIKDEKKQEKIYSYFHLLKEWSKKINLISRREIENNFLNLLRTSVFVYKKLEKYKTIIDFGAGAGFPSIPGKIIYDKKEIVLVEPGKREVFLKEVIKELNLKNISVEKKSFEKYFDKKIKKPFEIGISWGIREKINLLKTGRNFVSIGYVFITGPNEVKRMKNSKVKYVFEVEKIRGKALLSLVFARKFHVEQ